MVPDIINIRRIPIDKAKKLQDIEEFVRPSSICGKVVAVYEIDFGKEDVGLLYISEYENGLMWTIAENFNELGSMTDCIKLLINYAF